MRGIGDNGGPPLDPEIDPRRVLAPLVLEAGVEACLEDARTRDRAPASGTRRDAGHGYRAYTLEIMERGVHL